MATYYPYLNRGSYQWVPDTYAATSDSSFGVTDAYNFAVCNYGRHVNMLAGKDAGKAFATTVISKGITDNLGKIISDTTQIYLPGAEAPESIEAPFIRKIRRGTSKELNSLKEYPVSSGFGFSYQNIEQNPFFFFSTVSLLSPSYYNSGGTIQETSGIGTGRIASVDIEYMLATSALWENAKDSSGSYAHSDTNPPLTILAVIDDSLKEYDNTWLSMSRPESTIEENGEIITTTWGPASQQIATDSNTQAALSEIKKAIGVNSNLYGIFLPMYIYKSNGSSSYPELAVTHPSAYEGTIQNWGITSRRSINIKLSGSYWTSLDYFPKILGFLIMPNWRVYPSTESPMNPQVPKNPWNSIISGIRVYDALQSNTVPEHTKSTTSIVNGKEQTSIETVPSQLPCEVFSYAWRISHVVTMSKFTSPIQPSLGTLLTNDPGDGYGNRRSTFYFKIYHPDIPTLGVSHGVRFYYGLAVLPILGTSLLGFSLAGLLLSLALDTDLLMVTYMGPRPGTQTLTFQFGSIQYGNSGKTAYSGDFGFGENTVGIRCGWADGSSTSPPLSTTTVSSLTWLPITDGLPNLSINGTKVLFEDPEGTDNRWYAFASVNAFGVKNYNIDTFGQTYTGGLTSFVKGLPKTNVSGPGAFGMSVTSSSTFAGSEKITVQTKSKQYKQNISLEEICQDNDNHLVTFISEVRNIGPDIQMYGGTWRLKLSAQTTSNLKLNSQIFFRFAFVPNSIDDNEIDLSTLNGSALWDNENVFEFYFDYIDGNYSITSGTPNMSNVISTPILSEQEIVYDLSWDAYYGSGSYITETTTDLFEKKIKISLSEVMNNNSDVRLVVQAWSANFVSDNKISKISNYYNPDTDMNYPVVKMAWSGETESMFQTMILETKSGAIFAQQDPYVAGNSIISFNDITTIECSESSEKSISDIEEQENVDKANATGEEYIPLPFRNYPLWENKVSFSQDFLKPSSGYSNLKRYGHLIDLSDKGDNSGRLSLMNFAVPEISDLTDDKAQTVDIAIVAGEDLIDSTVGGTTIGPTKFNISFDYITNNSTYNIKYIVELIAIASNNITVYKVTDSGLQTINTIANPDISKEYSGSASFSMIVNNSILIPDPYAKLALRFKLWPNKTGINSTDFMSKVNSSRTNFDASFTCLDIQNFNISMELVNKEGMNNIDIIVGNLAQRGSSDWYEDLPAITSKTFGSSDYYFVADKDSTLTTIAIPAAISPDYGYWRLYGWMFSPFWFLEMPDGACVEIKDDAGLTSGNVTGSGFSSRERAQRVLMFRTAIGTLPLASVSSDSENIRMSGKGVLARQRLEVSGSASASNFLSIVQNIQTSESLDATVNENYIRSNETILTGKNPLIISGSPGNRKSQMLYKGSISTSYLFYEEDSFDIDTHSSVIMLANYDGTLNNWVNPYGGRGSGTTGKVVFTNDMRLIGASVDPMDFSIYMAGYRANDLTNTAAGGTIVLKKMHPGLVFGTDSAQAGPLRIVDGKVTDETYNVRVLAEVQPVIPEGLSGNNIGNRLNTLSSDGSPLSAAESFPDVIVDTYGMVYVFYTLLSNNGDDAKNALGKIFCRSSHNGGYWFDTPFPIADLGYERAIKTIAMEANDASFQAKHITAISLDNLKSYGIFFWANGKIFMKMIPNPSLMQDKFKILKPNQNGKPENVSYSNEINNLYMIEGNTDFTDGIISSALDQWLYQQWENGDNWDKTLEDPNINDEWNQYIYSLTSDYDVSGKNNNYKPRNGKIPNINILKYSNAEDVPAQRVGALINANDEILIYYLNNSGDLMYKKIKIFGRTPFITPGLIIGLNTY